MQPPPPIHSHIPQAFPALNKLKKNNLYKKQKASEICDVLIGEAQGHFEMPGEGKKQAMHDNGEKSNHTPVPASTPTHPANLIGRQKHPTAVSSNVLARGSGKSVLVGRERNLAPHFIFSYAYSQVLSRKEMVEQRKRKKSQYINLISEGILGLYIYSNVKLEHSRSTQT